MASCSRLFDVFERFKTPVDVVTTSEVSVSVTVDDRAASRSSSPSSRLRRGVVRGTHGDRLRRGRWPAARSGAGRARPRRRSATCRCGWCRRRPARRNITFVIRERDVPTALSRLHDTFFAPYPVPASRGRHLGLSRCRVCSSSGHGRMGSAGRVARRRSTASRSPASSTSAAADRRDRRSARFRGADVAIDFTVADAVASNLPALAARGINVVIGTTGWQAHEAALRDAVAAAGIGVVAAANFSLGHERVPAGRRGGGAPLCRRTPTSAPGSTRRTTTARRTRRRAPRWR